MVPTTVRCSILLALKISPRLLPKQVLVMKSRYLLYLYSVDGDTDAFGHHHSCHRHFLIKMLTGKMFHKCFSNFAEPLYGRQTEIDKKKIEMDQAKSEATLHSNSKGRAGFIHLIPLR